MRKNLKKYYLKLYVLFIFLFIVFNNLSLAQSIRQQIDAYLKVYDEMDCFSGTVLVAKNDSIIFHQAYGMANYELKVPNTTQTVYHIASLTKPITAALVMQLVESGKIKFDAKIYDYLPDFNTKSGKMITIHQLLNHTSGLPHYESVHDFSTNISRLPYSHKEFLKFISELNLLFEPGTHFKYSSFGYYVLGAIIEKVTNTSYEKILKEKILQPAGMKNTEADDQRNLIMHRANGYDYDHDGLLNTHYRDMSTAFAAGNLCSTTEDLFLFVKALFKKKLFNQATLKTMLNKYPPGFSYGWFSGTSNNNFNYKEYDYYYHTGGINGFSSILSHYDDETTIIILGNFSFILREKIERDIYAIVNGGKYIIPKIKKQIKPDTKIFHDYIGKYEIDSLKHIRISGSKSGLYYETPDSLKYILIPFSNNEFYIKEKNIVINFRINSTDSSASLELYESDKLIFRAVKSGTQKSTKSID